MSVVNLANYRKPVPAVKPETKDFFCLRCQHNEFHLRNDGAVHCTGCGSRIRNLTVLQVEAKA